MYAAYLALLATIACQNSEGPEYRWWSTVNLYVPQLVWGLPSLLFAILAFVVLCKQSQRPRSMFWLPIAFLLPLLYVGGPLMGWNGFGHPTSPSPAANAKVTLRVMTYNIASHPSDEVRIAENIALAQPDVLLVQEASGTGLDLALKSAHPDWHVKTEGELIIATPLPLLSVRKILLPQLASDRWKSPAYVQCIVQVGQVRISVYDVHLSTPRPALQALRSFESEAMAQMESNTATRLVQAHQIAQAAANETGPTIIAGDFNAPEPSLLCRQIKRAGFRDAFSLAGSGYGFTTGHEFRLHQSYARVDHIYVSSAWRVHECFVGSAEGSDHRPVTAIISLAPVSSR